MTSRPALDRTRLLPSPPWTSIVIRDELDSTNSAILGQPPGSVLVAEHQLAGRGRLDRDWVAPARAGLTFSVIVRPTTPSSSWGWLPLLTGLALTDVIDGAVLKWPNDLLLGSDQRKVAGVLAQAAGDTVIIGIGLNVSTTRQELPVDTATSLELEGRVLDRTDLLLDVLAALGSRIQAWDAARGAGPAADYRAKCVTIGQAVRVHGVDGTAIEGEATDVDESGRLIVLVDGVQRVIAAGDVEHVRPVTQ
jgi:BirA family transcriptional regulator, biotin operon repressor / biotin---[acetyl-CoA-carboxylase] ligase